MLIRVGRTVRLPVRLTDADGSPATGVVPADITNTALYIYFSNGEQVTVALSGANWIEMGVGLGQPGLYHVIVPASIWTAARKGPFQYSVTPAGGGQSGGTSGFISGLTTTGVGNGACCYVSANNTVLPTDNLVAAKARCFGVGTNTPGTIQISGVVEVMEFTTVGGSPNPGDKVYLAAATDDTNTGAGKATATAPDVSGQTEAEIGICLNNSNYAGLKTCRVLLQVKKTLNIL
jgi:hypothetical protein